MATTFINDNILQCQIPVGSYGDVKSVKLNRGGLFSIDQNGMVIEYTVEPSITGVDFGGFSSGFTSESSSGNLIKVQVTAFPPYSEIYLKFGTVYLPYTALESSC